VFNQTQLHYDSPLTFPTTPNEDEECQRLKNDLATKRAFLRLITGQETNPLHIAIPEMMKKHYAFYKTMAKHFQTPSNPFPGSVNLTPTQLDESTCVLLAKVAEKIASDLEDLLQKVIFCLFLQHFSFPLTPHFVFLSF